MNTHILSRLQFKTQNSFGAADNNILLSSLNCYIIIPTIVIEYFYKIFYSHKLLTANGNLFYSSLYLCLRILRNLIANELHNFINCSIMLILSFKP